MSVGCEALAKQGQESAAREQLRALLKFQDLPTGVSYQANFALGDLLLKEGKAFEAATAYEAAVQKAAGPAESETALYNAALATARIPDPVGFARLEKSFSENFPASDRRAALALERGRMLEIKGDSAASRTALEEVGQLPGSSSFQAEAALRRANSLLRAGNYPEAATAFNEFEKAFPDSPLIPQSMASGIEARLRAKELTGTQARAEFAKILSRFPDSTLAPALSFQIARSVPRHCDWPGQALKAAQASSHPLGTSIARLRVVRTKFGVQKPSRTHLGQTEQMDGPKFIS